MTIGIGYLRDNFAHSKMTESLLGSTGVGRCPGLSNLCTLGLANQQDRSYATATELELIRFCPLPFSEVVWHLSTHVNNGDLVV